MTLGIAVRGTRPLTYVADRMAVLGEFRLRGLERDFCGTTAEAMGGLSFAIGR